MIESDIDNSGTLKYLKGVEHPDSINIKAVRELKKKKLKELSAEEYFKGIISGDRIILSRAITLVESSLQKHQSVSNEIIERCMPYTGKSIRIGITGIPGVGKSTFIEALGSMLTNKGKRVAVLTVDPSSTRTKGSILGDKTRMINLSTDSNAFIRPSPSAGTLGGVARKTRETIYLCEAAGFDTLLIETIGVGQSETSVYSMVDFFLLLMLAGTGDELQGIKRGIMELADMIVINKSDDNPPEKIKLAERTLTNALHLFPPSESGWIPKVQSCSSISGEGILKIWDTIEEYVNFTNKNKYFNIRRSKQSQYWFYDTILSELKRAFFSDKKVSIRLKSIEKKLQSNKINPFIAANQLLKLYSEKE